MQGKKPWTSQTTLSTIDQRRKAILVGGVKEYKRLAGPRRQKLKHDKQQWLFVRVWQEEAVPDEWHPGIFPLYKGIRLTTQI